LTGRPNQTITTPWIRLTNRTRKTPKPVRERRGALAAPLSAFDRSWRRSCGFLGWRAGKTRRTHSPGCGLHAPSQTLEFYQSGGTTAPLKKLLREFPTFPHYVIKRMSFCGKCGSPSVSRSVWRNDLERLLSTILIVNRCEDCGARMYCLKRKRSHTVSAGARELRWYPPNLF
jgi:hypothetical protein